MLIKREITPHLLDLATKFRVVAVTGPRQSGKTTLVKSAFPHYAYVTLEDIDTRVRAKEDPRAFFASFAQAQGLIIDEVQEVPELLSYLQGIVDQTNRPGFFILTGSQNFILYEKITQSLAGRLAILTLLPLSVSELSSAQLLPDSAEKTLFQGFYPPVCTQKVDPISWNRAYIKSYVERDVRQLVNVGDLLTFQRFLKFCAARIGNIINYAELSRDCEISPQTAKKWFSVLESSYITTLITPYYRNYNKRLIQSPKLYFYDTSLVCFLLGITTAQDLFTHPLRGAIFESYVISELIKYRYNKGEDPNIYFWRDVQGHEIDCLFEHAFDITTPIEIKSGMTIGAGFFKEILQWEQITNTQTRPYLVYAGNEDQERTHASVFAWNHIKEMAETIEENRPKAI